MIGALFGSCVAGGVTLWHTAPTVARTAYATVHLGSQGRLVVPAVLRRELGFEAGDELVARVEGRRLVVERRGELLKELQRELRAVRGDRSLVDELIAQRRTEAEREGTG